MVKKEKGGQVKLRVCARNFADVGLLVNLCTVQEGPDVEWGAAVSDPSPKPPKETGLVVSLAPRQPFLPFSHEQKFVFSMASKGCGIHSASLGKSRQVAPCARLLLAGGLSITDALKLRDATHRPVPSRRISLGPLGTGHKSVQRRPEAAEKCADFLAW